MFDLEKAVRSWRRGLERRSALSPRELDELEDHLRAHVDPESELDPGGTPSRKFAAARAALGEGAVLSREFAKGGMPRWRRLLVAGWVFFGASFVLPAHYTPDAGLGLTPPVGTWPYYGYDVFWRLLLAGGGFVGLLAAVVPNLAMVLTLAAIRGRARGHWRRMRRTLAILGLGTIAVGVLMPPMEVWIDGELAFTQHPGPGFWAWSLSFACTAAAFWWRDRQWEAHIACFLAPG